LDCPTFSRKKVNNRYGAQDYNHIMSQDMQSTPSTLLMEELYLPSKHHPPNVTLGEIPSEAKDLDFMREVSQEY